MRTRIVLLALILDQGSKAAVSSRMEPGESVSVAGDLIRLTYTLNPGAVFGLTFGGRSLHLILSMVALAAVAIILRRTSVKDRRGCVGLSMILGGAIGNIIDRLRFGKVIDFLDLGIGDVRWYVFNVADAFVTVGVSVLLTAYLFRESPARPGQDPGTEQPEAGSRVHGFDQGP